ncbi:OmpP1/FadL family transporter [Sulfurimonas sp.]
MKNIIIFLLIFSSTLFSAGYQVPNNSVNSVALSTAYIANANGADSAYYNPANMVYNENNHEVELDATYVSLAQINYKSTDGVYDIKSKPHTAILPAFHYTSNKLSDNGIRVGFSMVTPYGLTREWENQPAISSAKKFELQTIELNPSLAIPINDKFSIGLGIRYLIAKGNVILDPATALYVDMKGDDEAFAYNIALSYKYSKELSLSATYRSDIMLNIEGDANVIIAGPSYSTGASLKVAIPDNLILASAYTFNDTTTIEATFDMTFWSKVTETNFEYNDATAEAIFGRTTPKKWHDTYAYRFGLTHKYNNILTLMGGIAYSTNAADEQYVSFSSPESDSMTYSIGTKYKINDSFKLGFAALYSENKSRSVTNTTVKGKLSDKSVYTLTAGASYKF